MLAHELSKIKAREQIAAWDAGEAKLAAGLPEYRRAELSVDVLDRFNRFAEWCEAKSVRKLPTKPSSLAAYVAELHALGHPIQNILAVLAAVTAVHAYRNLADPVNGQVHVALDLIVRVDPPRSWPKDQKAMFALLPPDIREVIAAREEQTR